MRKSITHFFEFYLAGDTILTLDNANVESIGVERIKKDLVLAHSVDSSLITYKEFTPEEIAVKNLLNELVGVGGSMV